MPTLKTIKQLADELHVSKTAIRKYLTEEFRQEHTETDCNGVIGITQEGCELIAETIANNRKPIAETTENTVSDLVVIPREVWDVLQEQLKSQAKQISDQSVQIAKLTSSLDNTTSSLQAAQALHAGTIQKQLVAPKQPLFGWFKKKGSE